MTESTWTPKQQKEHRALWVAALRSGEFEQARSRLRKSEVDYSFDTDEYIDAAVGYCCLGVACELYRRETGNGRWDHDNFTFEVSNEWGEKTITSEDTELPEDVRVWLGLDSLAGRFEPPESLAAYRILGNGESHTYLTVLNDGKTGEHDAPPVDFNRIADVVESEPAGLVEA